MVSRGWRRAVVGGGLLVLVGCVVLLAVLLKVMGVQDAASVAGILSVVLALPALAIPLVLWWRRATLVTAPRADQVSQARETLAGLVSAQWRHEALARSLGNPEPMPVQWQLTEQAVMDHPRLIHAGRLSFTGRSDQIGPFAEAFRGLRCRRLVILGGPGSGKTTLAVQLLLALLATPHAGEPIPVLLSLASWDPTVHPQLHGWLAERLAEDYPSLRAYGPDVARALAEQGHILPILDGLDELPLARQPDVITALNASLTEADQLVLTSRTREYETAIAEAHKVLTAAAVIEPEPLTPAQAADYLQACLPPDPGPSWRNVLDQLRGQTVEHLATVVATPLGLWLLRTVYISSRADPRPLLNATVARDAATMQAHLFDQLIPAVLATRPVSRNPQDTFWPQRTWDPTRVRRWLVYLAQHLDKSGTRDLLWWHLARHTFTRRTFGWTAGLVFGLATGPVFGLAAGLEAGLSEGSLVALMEGLVWGLTWGLTFGLVAGVAVGVVAALGVGRIGQNRLTDKPAYANLQLTHRTGMLAQGLGVGLVVGLGVGLAAGLLGGLENGLEAGLLSALSAGLIAGLVTGLATGLRSHDWLTDEPAYANLQLKHRAGMLARDLGIGLMGGVLVGLVGGLWVGLITGLAIGLGIGLVFGLIKWVGTPSRTSWASTPRSTYEATRALTIIQMCVAALMGGLGFWLAFGLAFRLGIGLETGLGVGLSVGLVGGLGLMSSGAWFSSILTSWRLAAAGKLPLRLMDFLDDAHRLGLLRTTGPAYQFRHAEFHDYLTRTSNSRTQAHAKPSTTTPK